jgi:deoxyribose-phosphate aldolase
MPQEDIDRLVQLITERVRARLGGAAAAPATAAAAHGPCVYDDADCEACGRCAARRPAEARAIRDVGADRIGGGAGIGEVASDLAGLIDHTMLKADATAEDLRKLCEEAKRYHFASVCVNSTNVGKAAAYLAGTGVMVCAVVGFPLGAMAPTAKAYEAREAVRAGAQEIDMVINIGALKSRDYETVLEDIRRVVDAARPARVKVILETGALTSEEKVVAITLSRLGGAHFVKTSTGFGKGGATVEDIALMRRLVGNELGVKASGGIRTREDAEKMVAAGATRIGASASVAIVTGQKSDHKGY